MASKAPEGCRRELLDRTLIWNQRHLMTLLLDCEDFYNTHRPHRYNTHRPHRALNGGAPFRPLPTAVLTWIISGPAA